MQSTKQDRRICERLAKGVGKPSEQRLEERWVFQNLLNGQIC
jgi:hypothetical protein